MKKERDNGVVGRFADIVGKGRFYDSPEVLEAYSKDHSFVPQRKPLAIIKPKDTDEVKPIIDLANETLMPLIPTSSGFPKFHGDTIPAVPGVVVDLSGLSKVFRVDGRNKIAAIEPGVTFGKLREACGEKGIVPYTPLLPRSTKSVLASALEREPITVPKDHWDFRDPIAGGRVVIGDGHDQGFGNTAGRSKKEVETGEAIPVFPLGPSNIGWLSLVQGAQGTIGIVPWGVVRLRLKPSIQKPFFVPAQALRDILPFSHKILRPRFVEEFFILNAFGLASILSEEAREIKKIQAALPPWMLFLNTAGYMRYPEEEIEWKVEAVRKIATEEGVELRDGVGGFSAGGLLRILEKTADKDRRLRYKDSSQVLPFETLLSKTPELAASIPGIAGDCGYPAVDISIYIQPVIQGCQCQCEVVFPYDPEDKLEVERVKNLFVVLANRMSELGAYYSRPYGALADITYGRDAEAVRVLRKIKGIMDPNNIMNAGKLCF